MSNDQEVCESPPELLDDLKFDLTKSFHERKFQTVGHADSIFNLENGIRVEVTYDTASVGGASLITVFKDGKEVDVPGLDDWFDAFIDGAQAAERIYEDCEDSDLIEIFVAEVHRAFRRWKIIRDGSGRITGHGIDTTEAKLVALLFEKGNTVS